jgi:hypothetical protein
VRCSFSPGRSAIRNPCTSRAAASFLRDLLHEVGLGVAAGEQGLARQLLGFEHAVDGLTRGGQEVEGGDLLQVLDQLLLDVGSHALPGRALRDQAEVGEAGPDRAVEGEALVLGHHDVLDELAEVCLTSIRCLPEQTPSRSLGVMPMASPSR